MANAYKDQQKSEKAADLEARCIELLKRHKKVEAVKLYRHVTGCGLRAALGEIEKMKF